MKEFHFQILIGVLFILFLIYAILKLTRTIEGLETQTNSSSQSLNISTSANMSSIHGVGGNSDTYSSNIKSNTIKLQDTFLINKYRKNYETVILNLDDLINNLMLQTTLNIDNTGNIDKVLESLKTLNTLSDSKNSLNKVMKFIDSKH
jgi:hypothetical protein